MYSLCVNFLYTLSPFKIVLVERSESYISRMASSLNAGLKIVFCGSIEALYSILAVLYPS